MRHESNGAGRTPARLRVDLLGPLAVYTNGQAVPSQAWDRQKTKSLLKLLLTVPGRTFSSEEIIENLWPALDPEAASKSVRAAMSKLRKVLEPDLTSGQESTYIRTERVGYAFQPESGCVLDTHLFQTAVTRGQEAQRHERWADALAAFDDALPLYRGDFLADEPDAMWVTPHREHWRKVQQTLLAAKAECHVALGQYAAANAACQLILDKDRCHEGAYRQLMLCHYLSGHLNEVVVLFRQCGDLLKQELGVNPSEETVRLYEHILRRRVPGIDNTPRSPVTVKRVYRAPHSLGRLDFVGRDHEVGVLASHLSAAAEGQGQVVAIGGEPGIGKTRLAEELLVYARSQSFLTAAGRCYSPALRRPYEPFAEILRQLLRGPGQEVLSALNPIWLAHVAKLIPECHFPKLTPSPPAPSPEQEKGRFCEAIARVLIGVSSVTPLVLLLDDVHWADHDTLDLLHTLIARSATERVLILLTYRSDEERAPGTAWVDLLQRSSRRLVLPQLADESVVAMLRTMARKGDFTPQMEQLGRRIHDETHGNPLFVVEVLQTLLEQGVLKVNGRGKWALTQSPDQASWSIPSGMRQVMLSRVERLSPEGRMALGLLSTLNRWCTRELIESLLAHEGMESAQVLDELVRVGFLHEHGDPVGSYRFAHEHVRQSVYESLSASQRQAYHLRMARVLDTVPSSGATVQELAHHFQRAEVWPKAFHYAKAAAEAAQRQYLLPLAHTLVDEAERILTLHGARFLQGRDTLRQQLALAKLRERIVREQGHAKKWHQVVAEMVRLARKVDDPEEMADAFLALSSVYGSRREWAPAIEVAQQALVLYQGRGLQEGMARAYRDLGYIYWHSDRGPLALEANRHALELHHAVGNAKGVAGDLHNLAQVYTSLGEYDSALEYCRQARWEYQKLGERGDEAKTLHVLSHIARRTGNLPDALAHTTEALELARESQDRDGELSCLTDAASLWHAMGNPEKALEAYQAALEAARAMGGSRQEGHALRGMGLIYEQMGEGERAAACFHEAATLLSASGDEAGWAEVCQRLGAVVRGSAFRDERTRAYYHTLVAYVRKAGSSDELRAALNAAGRAAWAAGRPEEAMPFYTEALHLARTQRDRAAEVAAQAALGVVYREGGRLKEALEVGRRALAGAEALRDEQMRGYILASLCETYLALGRTDEAEQAARALIHRSEGDPGEEAWAYFRLGRVLYERGEEQAGQVYFNKAKMLESSNPDPDLRTRIAAQHTRVRHPAGVPLPTTA